MNFINGAIAILRKETRWCQVKITFSQNLNYIHLSQYINY